PGPGRGQHPPGRHPAPAGARARRRFAAARVVRRQAGRRSAGSVLRRPARLRAGVRAAGLRHRRFAGATDESRTQAAIMAAMTPPAPAPELTHALTWVNSDPLRLAELRGRVVVLWFWHGASALCHNVLDDLRQLQARHGAALCLVGIHTPKYDGERDPRQVLKLVNRLGIRFPVASDADFVAWQHYGMAGWPATLLIDRQGSVRKVVAGDLRREELEAAAEALLREPTGDSVLDEPFRPAQHPEPRQALAFPSGLAVTPAHLYI